jgi:hypothetical protein
MEKYCFLDNKHVGMHKISYISLELKYILPLHIVFIIVKLLFFTINTIYYHSK